MEVVVIRAIPKKLLIHAITTAKASGEDFWGSEEQERPAEVTHVRIEPSSKVVRGKNNAELQLAAILFYDCKNSRPQGHKWAVDDLVHFGEENYSVKVVEPLYDEEKLHHYEMGLVKHA